MARLARRNHTVDLEFRPSPALMAMLHSAEFLRDNQSKMPVWNAPIILRDVSIEPTELPPHFAHWWPTE